MAAAVFVLPRVIQSTGARIASEALGRGVTIGEVSVQPWRLALELKDLRIAGRTDQDPPLFEMAQAKVALSARTFWHFVPVIESVALSRPVLRLSRTAPGAYDVDDLIAKFSAKPAEPSSGPPPALALYNITLDQGQVLFDDRPMARKHELAHLNIGLPFLSTRDADVKVLIQPSVSGQLNGVEFGSEVEALPFSTERDATLRFKLGSLDLAPYIPYVPAGLPLRLAAGKVDADLTVRFQQPPKQAPKLDISGQVGLSEFDLQQPGGSPWLAWQKLSIGLQAVQPFQQKLAFGEVNWQGLRLNLARDAAGKLWLPTAAPEPVASAAPAAKVQDQKQAKAVPAAPAAPAWAISLAKFSLGDAQVNWRDASVPGKAALQAKALKLELGAVQWPLKALTPLSFDMQIQPEGASAKSSGKKAAPSVASANLKGQGSLSAEEAKLDLQWDQLALQWFEPYWAAQLPMQLKAKAAGRLSLGVTQPLDADPLARLQVGVQDLLIEQLALGAAKSPTGEPLLRLDSVKLDSLDMAYGAKTVQLGELSLDAPGLMLARAKNNDWNWQALLPQSEPAKAVSKPAPRGRPVLKLGGEDDAGRVSVATSTAPVASTSKSATDWQVALRDLKLNRGSVRLQDAAAPGGQANLSVQQLTLRLGQLAWPKASGSSPAQLSFKLAGEAVAKQAASRKGQQASAPARPLSALSKAAANSPGSFSWQGNIALAPLAASGKLRAERLPLQLLSAYMDPSLDLNLQRVDLGWRGDFNVRQLPKDWQVNVNGDLLLADLSLQQGRKQAAMGLPGTDLLTWQAFHLDGVRFEMKPGSKPDLAVKELRLNDFYASVLINEKGRLNLSDIRAEPDAAQAKPASEAGIALVASPVTPSASAAPGSAAANAAPGANLPIQISLGQTTLSKGRVDFADRFIRPNYSAQLTELQGGLGAVRSGRAEMAPLQLRGRVAGTGLLAIDGALNPLGAPLMLDIKASATDIELAPMSPYSEKYAGYQIERGKLSTKVAYKIDPDGQLKASNQLILNQLTFGEAVNSPDATKLPVRLAVSLLKDSDGVIDVELPVSGSLNDPQFSVGGVIFKLIINLIGKALTSPFSLLSGVGGSEHSQIEFALGSAQPTNPATLEKIAKALADKPTLALTITGWADLALERSALQQAQLDAALLAQKRLELQRRQTAGADAQAAAELTLSEAERNRLLKVVYEATKLPNKPRNMLGFAKDISVAEMRSLMLASYTVNEETAHALSLARGVAVRDGLIAKGLPNQRIFVAAPKLHSAQAGDSGWKPLVELKLGGD